MSGSVPDSSGWNSDADPIVWTATAGEILAKVRRIEVTSGNPLPTARSSGYKITEHEDMDLHLHIGDEGRLVEQIYGQLYERIVIDALPAGTVLPPSRELSARLSVSRATVVAAYERLAAHGLIRSRAGIGTFVTGRPVPAVAASAASPLRPRASWRDERLAVPDLTRPAAEFDFGPGLPAHTMFPFARWRALVNDQLRARTEVGYADPMGSARLRDALARHLVVSRGLQITPEQLVITTGAQQAFDIAARVLIDPGDTVAVEDPGYLPAYRAFLAHGAHVVGVPVDSEGLVVDQIPAGTRMVYVTPSHQFPLGMPMSESRRAALLAWAARHDAAIVEDDYDSEFRFTGRPITPLQATGAGVTCCMSGRSPRRCCRRCGSGSSACRRHCPWPRAA